MAVVFSKTKPHLLKDFKKKKKKKKEINIEESNQILN